MKSILDIKNLNIEFRRKNDRICAVRDISFSIFKNEITAIVGESGCGKSALAKSIVGLLPENAKISSGSINYEDTNLLDSNQINIRKIRGKEIGMVFQDPFLSLNPTMKIGKQISEVLLAHNICSHQNVKNLCHQILDDVKIKNPTKCFEMYPHHLSGGMKQRVLIAIAIACRPKLLIADEPTTALDVTIQAQILKLLKDLHLRYEMDMLFITHDMTVVANLCSKIIVMYAGEIVEMGDTIDVIRSPQHPYTKMLLDSVPTLDKHKVLNKLRPIEGFLPVINNPLTYCSFVQRCPYAMQICIKKRPKLTENKQKTRCWLNDKQKSEYESDRSYITEEIIQTR
jgi:oligopeptide/dipeptide ABC transporter ATP-binding protein